MSYESPFANYTWTKSRAGSRPLVGQLQGTFKLYYLLYATRLKRSGCYIQTAMTLDNCAVLPHNLCLVFPVIISVNSDYFFRTALNYFSF